MVSAIVNNATWVIPRVLRIRLSFFSIPPGLKELKWYLFLFWFYDLVIQESSSVEKKILSIRISNHQFYKLLPVKLDQEQLDELELEAKIQGLFVIFF